MATARTVLIIVDGEEIYSGLGLLLEKRGYRVSETAHNSKALEILSEVRPDLILFDTDHSPARSLVAARALRERAGLHDAVIVIASSQGRSPSEGKTAGSAAGQNDYVILASDFEQLKEVLNRLHAPERSLAATEAGAK